MKPTGAGVLRKRSADPEPVRKSDRAQITLAEMVRRIQQSAVADYVVATEFVANCPDDDYTSAFAEDIIDW